MANMSDYLENKLIDQLFRGQAYSFPATLYMALFIATPTDVAASGTEVTGGSYARVAVTSSLANWAGTQGATTTTASTGTNGTTSNNTVITFTTPTATWGTVTSFAIFDALTAGNMLIWGPLTISNTISSGNPVNFQISQLSFQIDN